MMGSSMSVFIRRAEMEQAIAPFGAAGYALAEHGTGALEHRRGRFAPRRVVEVEQPRGLAGLDLVIRVPQRLGWRVAIGAGLFVASDALIALTAFALKEDEQKSLAAGCDGHLTKPIKKKELLAAVSCWGRQG